MSALLLGLDPRLLPVARAGRPCGHDGAASTRFSVPARWSIGDCPPLAVTPSDMSRGLPQVHQEASGAGIRDVGTALAVT